MDMGQPQGRICGSLGGNSSKTLKTNLFPPFKTSARPGVVHSTSSTPAHYARQQRCSVVQQQRVSVTAWRPRVPGAGLVAQISAAEARQSEQRRGPSNNTESPLLRDTIGFRNFNIDAVTTTRYSVKVPLSPSSLLEPPTKDPFQTLESIPSLL